MLDLTQPAAVSADELRDALAAIAEALDVPRGDVRGTEAQLDWLVKRSVRAAIAAVMIEWILKPGAPVADHVRNFREQIAARSGL